MKMNLGIRIFSAMLTLALVFTLTTPATVRAAAPPNVRNWTYSESQLKNANLSPGTISWDDDLVSGYIEVWGTNYNYWDYYNTNCNYYNSYNGNYNVTLYEELNISDASPRNMTKKQIAKREAQLAFLPVRANAQNRGWWDCQWNFTKVKNNKVAATAVIEYKSVTTNRNSKSVTVRQITKKKNGRWETRFFIGDRSYTASQLTSIFS